MKNTLKAIHISDNNKLIISKAAVDDAPRIVDFLNKVGGESDFLTFGLNAFPFSVEEEKEIILECLEKNLCLMLVAKVDDEVVSQLFLQRSANVRLMHLGDIAVSVGKEYWGKSIGKHMMLTAIEWAKNNGVTKLQLQVRSDNARAIQLYEKLGFVIEGKLTRAIRVNNVYFDDYIMGFEL